MVQWHDDLSVGVLEVDIQHKLLFEKFNAFLDACEKNAEMDGIYRLFWFLEAYAITHFSEEEKLMQRVGYPEYARHREKHVEFAASVSNFKARLHAEGPNPDLVSSITRFISGWLIDHISNMDRAIGRFVTAAGIPAI